MILAPLIKDRKGEHKKVLDDVRKAGYVRVRVNGDVLDVNEDVKLDRYKQHTIEAVVDRLVVKPPTRTATTTASPIRSRPRSSSAAASSIVSVQPSNGKKAPRT